MNQESQQAEVTIRVELTVDQEASEEKRKQAICRKLRLELGDEISLHPGLLPEAVTLTKAVDMEELARRRDAEAEAQAEARMERRRERYFDNHGHF